MIGLNLFFSPVASAQIDFISKAVKINCNNSQGAGFWIDSRIIATAKHVVEKCSTAIVENNDGFKFRVSKIELSRKSDIAYLIMVKSNNSISYANFPKNLPVSGEYVYAVGAPIDGLVLSKGKFVRSFANNLGEWIEIDIPADHGNSGGPVFSDSGVVGMLISKDLNYQTIKAYSIGYVLEDYIDNEPNFDESESQLVAPNSASKSPLLTQVLSASIMFVFGIVLGVFIGQKRANSKGRSKERIKIYV